MRRKRGHATALPRPRASRRLELGTGAIRVDVRESTRARRARLVVHPDGSVEVVVPCGAPDRVIESLIGANGDWIAGHVWRAQERASRVPALALDRPGLLPLQGSWIPVVRCRGRRAAAELRDGRLVVRGGDEQAGDAILRWYRREARRVTGTVLARESERLGVAASALAVRDQRSRWASCSRSGTLSFSWRLVLAPPAVLDYVVVHELCHLVEPNHSKAFWRLVEAALPGWRAPSGWLRDHGHELRAFVPRPGVRTRA